MDMEWHKTRFEFWLFPNLCVTLGKLLNLSKIQFLLLTYVHTVVVRINELMC